VIRYFVFKVYCDGNFRLLGHIDSKRGFQSVYSELRRLAAKKSRRIDRGGYAIACFYGDGSWELLLLEHGLPESARQAARESTVITERELDMAKKILEVIACEY